MTSEAAETLLSAHDPSPVRIANPAGTSLFLLVGDHAGNHVPAKLASLGLSETNLERHIAIDIGVSRLGSALAASLDATFIEQRYSRLVVDCNRAKTSPDSIVPVSDGTVIPANAALDRNTVERRYREVFDPYHAAIASALNLRARQRRDVVLISLHSFTPTLGEEVRPWSAGILFDGGDTTFARSLLDQLRLYDQWCVGDNQPYRMDYTDYTVPFHVYPRGLPYAEIEIRQDHLATYDGVISTATALSSAIVLAATAIL